jgi:hypothetical protein
MSPKAIPGEAPALAALTIKTEAQQVLDELWSEKLIPFSLTIGKITKSLEAYTLHFYDSRMSTALIPSTERHLFREMVRSAVLARVGKISGPLTGWPTKKH